MYSYNKMTINNNCYDLIIQKKKNLEKSTDHTIQIIENGRKNVWPTL